MREAQVNLAIRWFIGYGLHEALPDHSSLTRIRQRWGVDRFRAIFERSVRSCVAAGITTGEVVHVDATLIRANVSFDRLASRHLDAVEAASLTDEDRLSRKTGRFKKICVTDPEASMATNSARQKLQPSYKQHTAVDDASGVVVDVAVGTGEESDTARLAERIDVIERVVGRRAHTITADRAYGIGSIYAALAERRIDGVIPHRPVMRRSDSKGFCLDRFAYDQRNDIVRCLRKRILTPRNTTASGRWYRARVKECQACSLRSRCIPGADAARRVHLSTHHSAIVRARRRRLAWSDRDRALYARHRWRVEGIHGEAKTQHGLARAIRRGLQNMTIQALLTATTINLKRLAQAIRAQAMRLIRTPHEPHLPSQRTQKILRTTRNDRFFNRPHRTVSWRPKVATMSHPSISISRMAIWKFHESSPSSSSR
jgi:IS5 family transposase